MPTVNEILTYDGSSTDIILNYIALVVCLFPFLFFLLKGGGGKVVYWWVAAFMFLWAFQIGLCLAEGCTGISVVWNAIIGHAVVDHIREKVFHFRILLFAGVFAAVIDAYYLFTAEMLTTVAHVCALLLGSLLSGMWWYCGKKRRGYAAIQ
eukprot:TRINITY_DN16088_c0_g1_i1.p1 TRINITY_DN16088_c0_g1~~TRINITY_DN16088_c0_g1_i1.p1  ORF type:complete len:151 (+),score=23.65 TRINITY_DN16088_c0_g1_i1:229-681(+)